MRIAPGPITAVIVPFRDLSGEDLVRTVRRLDARGPNPILTQLAEAWESLSVNGRDVVEAYCAKGIDALFPPSFEGWAALVLVKKAIHEGVAVEAKSQQDDANPGRKRSIGKKPKLELSIKSIPLLPERRARGRLPDSTPIDGSPGMAGNDGKDPTTSPVTPLFTLKKSKPPRTTLPAGSKANGSFRSAFSRAIKTLEPGFLGSAREPWQPMSATEFDCIQVALAFEDGEADKSPKRGFATPPKVSPNVHEAEAWYRHILSRWSNVQAMFNLAFLREKGWPAAGSEDEGVAHDTEEALELYEEVLRIITKWPEAGHAEDEGSLNIPNLQAAVDDVSEQLGKAPLPLEPQRLARVLDRRRP